MGFVQNIGTSLRLSAASFRLLFQAPRVLLLPLGTLVWSALLAFGPAAFLIWLAENHPDAFGGFFKGLYFITVKAWESGDYGFAITSAVIESYILYAIWLTLVLTGVYYFLTAGMHMATQQIRQHGQDPSLGEAFGVASRNLHRIFFLALFNATVFAWVKYTLRFGLRLVTLPLALVPFLGRMARNAIGGAVAYILTIVSYLMLPIIIYERAGPLNAMKSAWNNVKKTWSGIMVGGTTLFVGIFLLYEVFMWGVFQLAIGVDATVTMILSIIGAAVIYAFASSAAAAMRATLYWYATTGEVPEGFNESDLPDVVPSGPLTAASAAGVAATPTTKPQGDAGDWQESRRLKCPQCGRGVEVTRGAKPNCPDCGYS